MRHLLRTIATGMAAVATMAAASAGCVALGESQQLAPHVAITPLRVVEDSRCPPDVMCIQAGRLVVEAELRHRDDRQRIVLALGEQMRVKGGMLTFAYATPPANTRARGADGGVAPAPPPRFGYSYVPDNAG